MSRQELRMCDAHNLSSVSWVFFLSTMAFKTNVNRNSCITIYWDSDWSLFIDAPFFLCAPPVLVIAFAL